MKVTRPNVPPAAPPIEYRASIMAHLRVLQRMKVNGKFNFGEKREVVRKEDGWHYEGDVYETAPLLARHLVMGHWTKA